MRASTVRSFPFSFAAFGCLAAATGVYRSQFPFFLRRLSMQDSCCGHLPFTVSLFPSPPFDTWQLLRASTVHSFPFFFAAAGK